MAGRAPIPEPPTPTRPEEEDLTSPFVPMHFPADPSDDDLALLWEALAPERTAPTPVIRAVMVTSLDGRAVVDGRSGPLGTPTDDLLFHLMRSRADIVVVGARTAVVEGYGPTSVDPRWRRLRLQDAPPRLVLLTRAVGEDVLDLVATHGPGGYTLVAPEGDPRVDRAESLGVEVVRFAGDPGRSLRELASGLGAREVVCEGGPTLLASMLSADVVDELVLTTSPRLDATSESLGLVGHTNPVSRPFRVTTAFTAPDGGLYARWVRDREAG